MREDFGPLNDDHRAAFRYMGYSIHQILEEMVGENGLDEMGVKTLCLFLGGLGVWTGVK